jgi:hypothetical protein
MITYDLGVIGEFEHTSFASRGNPTPTLERICYIGECKFLSWIMAWPKSLFYFALGCEPQLAM